MEKYTTVILTDNSIAIIDACDFDLNNFKWTGTKSGRNGEIYPKREIKTLGKRKSIFLYQVIMERILNRPLKKGELVDHKDRNPLNNRRDNLRLADRSQNSANSKLARNNTSGWRGVYYSKRDKIWISEIGARENRVRLGRYETSTDAAIAYNHAAEEKFGEFASLNDIQNWKDIVPIPLKRGNHVRSDNKSGHVRINFVKSISKFRSYSKGKEKVYLGQFNTVDEALEAQNRYTETNERNNIHHEWRHNE